MSHLVTFCNLAKRPALPEDGKKPRISLETLTEYMLLAIASYVPEMIFVMDKVSTKTHAFVRNYWAPALLKRFVNSYGFNEKTNFLCSPDVLGSAGGFRRILRMSLISQSLPDQMTPWMQYIMANHTGGRAVQVTPLVFKDCLALVPGDKIAALKTCLEWIISFRFTVLRIYRGMKSLRTAANDATMQCLREFESVLRSSPSIPVEAYIREKIYLLQGDFDHHMSVSIALVWDLTRTDNDEAYVNYLRKLLQRLNNW